jgi:hypothetical protein
MIAADAEGGGYEIRNSAFIAQAFLSLQRQAKREGRGQELLQAARTIYERMRQEPTVLGEPLYRLPALRMRVRCVALGPLYVDFAVCEDRPLVFIKSVKLLPARKSP